VSKPFTLYSEMICEESRSNEEFTRSCPAASETLKLLVDLWNYTLDVEVECFRSNQPKAVPLTLLHIVQPQIYGMICNFLIGNLPACYMSMRVVLEAVVDAVIVSGRFCDSPFPNNLEHLRRLERETRLSFADKCRLLIPTSAQNIVEDVNDLWSYLSEYWAHAKGIVRKLDDKVREIIREGQSAPPPMWALALPYRYDETDIDDIREFVSKLGKLTEVVETLLEPFTKTGTAHA